MTGEAELAKDDLLFLFDLLGDSMFQLKLYLLYIKVIMVSGELTIVVSACLLRSEEQ